jgi:uncharacterized protein (TIGR00369 family)
MPNWKSMLDVATSGNVTDDQLSPYIKFLSLPKISRWQDKTIVIDWQASAESHQGSGMVFGGYISALADYAAGSAMLTILEENDIFFTKKLEIEYKRPIRSEKIAITAEVIERSGINVVVRVNFINEKEFVHAVAHAYQTIFSK